MILVINFTLRTHFALFCEKGLRKILGINQISKYFINISKSGGIIFLTFTKVFGLMSQTYNSTR